jgi:DNA polymerase-3 subunit epsilon
MGRRPQHLIWTDSETTGLQPRLHGIIELAMIKTPLDASQELDSFHVRIRVDQPDIIVDPEAMRVNHYDETLWKDAVPIEQALNLVERMCVWGTQFAGHNVCFDKNFLVGSFHRCNRRIPSFFSEDVDTLKMAYPLYALGHVSDLKLGTVAKYFGIEQRAAHTAIEDVRTSMAIYRQILKLFPPRSS